MKSRTRWLAGALVLLVLLVLKDLSAGAAAEDTAINLAKGDLTIFSFDDHTTPFKDNLYLTMVPADKYEGNPVVPRGPAGSVDSYRAQFYGSVIREGDRFRMWYAACHYDDSVGEDKWGGNPEFRKTWRIAYAESQDGIRWVKPNLGLTPFKGNKNNNLVQMGSKIDMQSAMPLATFVLHEPDDPDPSRRYKMAVYGLYEKSGPARLRDYGATIYPYFSADGLRWELAMTAPKAGVVKEDEVPFTTKWVFEIGGLYKFDDVYHVAGQEVWPDVWMPNGEPVRRTMTTHWSGDFVHWSQEKSLSFLRYGYRSLRENLEESHEPAAVWNRGNVLLGVFGLWHGATDRTLVRMDLGFLVSNNGVHFREPVADHALIKAGASDAWDRHGLIHGQGFENVGDKTYIYYGSWDPGPGEIGTGAVGLAMLRRDGFGYLSTMFPGKGSFTTTPLVSSGRPRSLFLNADGMGEEASIRVELIDKLGQPISGYAEADAAIVKNDGLRTRVLWGNGTRAGVPDRTFRVRVHFEGESADAIRFYAAYVE